MPKRTNASWSADKRVKRARLSAVLHLRKRGYSFKEIAMSMRLTPYAVRSYHGKAERLTTCTCPAQVDITYTGHLPECNAHEL